MLFQDGNVPDNLFNALNCRQANSAGWVREPIVISRFNRGRRLLAAQILPIPFAGRRIRTRANGRYGSLRALRCAFAQERKRSGEWSELLQRSASQCASQLA